MNTLYFKAALFVLLGLNLWGCNGQNTPKKAGTEQFPADFDETLPFDYKMPGILYPTDTSPGAKQSGQKITLTGTIYEYDGVTPAPNIILYYNHTDVNGVYATNEGEERNMPKNKLGHTHGYIRGWIKTGNDGKYAIHTVMPGTYPSRDEPAHVHLTVKEKNKPEPYYLDDFVFDNDKLLTTKKRNQMENRGGNGVIRFVEKNRVWIGERNIILGLNIPNYPKDKLQSAQSGKQIGEDLHSFTPYHAYGPDKGTRTCPICKYGWYHGILYCVGKNPNWNEIKDWLKFLEAESQKREAYLKVYFIYGNEHNYSIENRIAELEQLGNELKLKNLALTFVPSFSDKNSEIYLNKINPKVENTFVIYKRSIVTGNFVNLTPTPENFMKIQGLLNQSENGYFELPRVNSE